MKQIRYYQIITAFCCLLLISCGIDKNLKKGEKFLSLGEYYDAADQFKQAYTKTPPKERENRGKLALKMARCYNKINATPKAVNAYRNAIRYNQASLDDNALAAERAWLAYHWVGWSWLRGFILFLGWCFLCCRFLLYRLFLEIFFRHDGDSSAAVIR